VGEDLEDRDVEVLVTAIDQGSALIRTTIT